MVAPGLCVQVAPAAHGRVQHAGKRHNQLIKVLGKKEIDPRQCSGQKTLVLASFFVQPCLKRREQRRQRGNKSGDVPVARK